MPTNELLLGENLGFFVESGRTTRAQLAEAAGTSVTNIGQLIRGENKGLKPVNLVRIARHLRESVEDLVERDFRSRKVGIAEKGAAYNRRGVAVTRAISTLDSLAISDPQLAERIAESILVLSGSNKK